MINGVTKKDSETPSFAFTVTVFERDESIAKQKEKEFPFGIQVQ